MSYEPHEDYKAITDRKAKQAEIYRFRLWDWLFDLMDTEVIKPKEIDGKYIYTFEDKEIMIEVAVTRKLSRHHAAYRTQLFKPCD